MSKTAHNRAAYTPTTEEIREAIDEWMWSRRMWRPALAHADGKELDRWRAAEVAAAEKRGAEKALKDFRWFLVRALPRGLVNRDRIVADAEESMKRLNETGYLLMGPLTRADEIERTTDDR